MFVSGEKCDAHVYGTYGSGVWTEANASSIKVMGGVFHGEVRELAFHEDGDLLVVAGLGVRRFDADTFEERERWLDGVHVQCVRPHDARLWVVVGDEVFLAEYGAPLGAPLTTIQTQPRATFTSGGGSFAAPEERGVCVVHDDGRVQRFVFDDAWYEGLWSKRAPSRALLSSNGRYVAASVEFSSYTVLWDVETGEELGASTSYESMAVLDGGRLVKADGGSSSYFDVQDESWSRLDGAEHMKAAFVGGGRLLGTNSRGDHVVFDPQSLEVTSEGEGMAQSYGNGAYYTVGAVSKAHVATYAAKQGVILVSSSSGKVEAGGWHGSAEALSVSANGRRLAVWRDWTKGRLDCVDLEEGTLFEVTDEANEGLKRGCITRNGERIVAACGNNLRARTVAVGAFDGGPAEGLQKIKAFVYQTLPYGDDRYVVATYTLQGAGFAGLYKSDSKRAIAKLTHHKEQARRVAVGHDDSELLVVWDSTTILYDITKRPKEKESIPHTCASIALGPPGFLAYQRADGEGGKAMTIRTPERPDLTVTLRRDGAHASERMAFSPDGSLLFVGAPDGKLEVRRARDAELLATSPLHAGAFVDVLVVSDTVWTMGQDGVVCAVGVPG